MELIVWWFLALIASATPDFDCFLKTPVYGTNKGATLESDLYILLSSNFTADMRVSSLSTCGITSLHMQGIQLTLNDTLPLKHIGRTDLCDTWALEPNEMFTQATIGYDINGVTYL